MLRDKWLIHYDPQISSAKDILESIIQFQKSNPAYLNSESSVANHPDPSIPIHHLDYSQNASQPLYQKQALDPTFFSHPVSLNTGPKIHTVGLYNPVQLSDKRWQTIHLTTSAIFLGSALQEKRFNVIAGKQVMPAIAPEPRLMSCDAVGFTLFEDLFLPFQTFLTQLRHEFHYDRLLAAGGPLITLNPLQAAYFLPELNLLVRGEAELIFPALLSAINDNNLEKLFTYHGFMLQVPGWFILSHLHYINRPQFQPDFRFNLAFLEKKHFEEGLEINVSRGCSRSCIFCSAVQGKTLRKLPESQFTHLLASFAQQLETFAIESPRARTVNINDDDILQDPAYAQRIFQIIQQQQFRLWGIQTSINSFFNSRQEIQHHVLDIIAEPSLYMENSPLIWLGTDAFLKERGKKLGKTIPDEPLFLELMEAFDEREIRNYHYWISSDHFSNWPEFVSEFILIYHLYKEFPYFGLIAHAPFLVPYSSTPLYRLLDHSPERTSRIKFKRILESHKKLFILPLVERIETPHINLNRLLNNEKLGSDWGFFDYLSQKDYLNALITLYNFLKQERIEAESNQNHQLVQQLKQSEQNLEELLSQEI